MIYGIEGSKFLKNRHFFYPRKGLINQYIVIYDHKITTEVVAAVTEQVFIELLENILFYTLSGVVLP